MGCPKMCSFGDNLVFSIVTHDPDTGVLTDADALPTYRIYRDGGGVVILNGTMSKLDDANTTGFYTESIECSSANQMVGGRTYTIYINSTVGGDTGCTTYEFKVSGGDASVKRFILIPESWH